MLEIIGSEPSKELDAAKRLKELLVDSVPKITEHHAIESYIIPSVQCYGQNPRDVDIVLMLWDQRQESRILKTTSGALIRSLCLTIEVKSHSSTAVWFRGGKCYVSYNGEDHDVSSQSEKQKYSLLNFLQDRFKAKANKRPLTPFIDNLIWLTSVPKSEIPAGTNVLGSDSTWQDFLDLLEALQERIEPKGKPYLGFLDKHTFENTKQTLVTKIVPSRIDRKKMEQISKTILTTEQAYAGKIGQQLLILRGRGGTGKTVRLLRMAYQLYNEKQLRVLVLTYNKALVSDLERLLSLMRIKDSAANQSIAIRSIYSFLFEWLDLLDVMNQKTKESYFASYEQLKDDALELLKAGAITREDIQNKIRDHSRALSWDIVMIDESQDWPENERDILYSLYGAEKFILADGVDQLVRGTKLINWRENLPTGYGSQIVPLRKSLRLKNELCKVVSKFAEEIDYENWDLQPIPESHGGKVIVYTGDPFNKNIIESALQSSKDDGNENIDNLICLPPLLAQSTANNDTSLAAEKFIEWGYSVWDGANSETRDSFPTSLDDIRLVQYDSCRGLEGWSVINLGFDDFFEYKKATPDIDEKSREYLFFDEQEAAMDFAKRWLMIPMTRAIDTLVIHISNQDSFVGQALYKISQRYPEEIEWVD